MSFIDPYINEYQINRKKYGLWIKNFPILGVDYYMDETGDKCLDFRILFLTFLSFDWEPKSGQEKHV